MLKTELDCAASTTHRAKPAGRVVVIWIDWYAYHVARFQGLIGNPSLAGQVAGIEMVGGIGVHAGLKFREDLPSALPVETLFPEKSWREVKGWKTAAAIWKQLNRHNAHVVLVPGYYTIAGLAAALWGKVKGRRTVLMTESTEEDHVRNGFKEGLKGLLIRFLFEWAIAGGQPHRRYLQRLGFPGDRIASFYDVVDNEFFSQRSQAIRKHSQAADFDLPARYFLYVGRLAEEKNLGGLLSAYLAYRQSGGDWPLVLVGDGPERRALEASAQASAYERDIYFAGLRSTAELPQYYAFAGCFVLPSTREPWGLVTNEAMAAGLPIIVSRRCGCAEDLLVEGKNGCSFDPSIEGDLAACLTAVGGLDDETLVSMGACSQEIISQFSPQAWAAEVARIAKS